jgi:hypothetical protein
VSNWRIILGGAASAAILTAGVAAPAFAASSQVSLNGITPGLAGSQAGEILCALPSLPVPVGVTAAAGAIGESCGSQAVSLVPGYDGGSLRWTTGAAGGVTNAAKGPP